MNPAAPPPRDLFISYRRTDVEIISALETSLERYAIRVWRDHYEIDDANSIQVRIDQGLANCRALLAWYSVDYPHSRPCQWELTAALIAARAETAPVRRLLVVNPEADPGHLVLPQVRDIEHLSPPAGISDTAGLDALAGRIAELLQPINGTFGALRALARPPWHGYAALGSNRFVGRVQALWDIHAALSAGDFAIVSGQPAPVSRGQIAQVRGSGGIGKSLLAEEYALRFGAFWPGGVFWLRAYGHSDRPEESAAALAQRREDEYRDQLGNFALAQGVAIRELDTRQIRAVLAARLQTREPYLWIVDDLPDGDRAELERWLAPSSNGQTLLTTRSRRHNALGKPIDLSLLPPNEARALLICDCAPQDAADQAAVDDILTRLDGHALALDVARAACRWKGYQGFRARLQQPDQDALALAEQLAGELPNGHNPNIAVTFLGSLQTLSVEGLDFLRLCAQLAAAPVERSLVARCLAIVEGLEEQTAEDRADLGMHQAIQASLAEAVQDRQAATVHTLIAHTLRLHDTDTDRQRALREAALTALVSDLKQVTDIRHHDALQDDLAHARVLAEQTGTAAEYTLIGWLGRYESERGNYRDAERFYRQQCEGLTRLLGKEHPDTLRSMNNLAGTLRAQSDLAAARTLHEQVLAARRRVLGEEHPDTLTTIDSLAVTLRAQDDLPAARALQEQVLAAQRRLLGEEHPDTSLTAWNLFLTLNKIQDHPAAQAILDKTLRWLLQRDPDTLSAKIREIREEVQNRLSR